ncbi:MAG: CcdB family protein [Myxococcales bacterium]|nr:CcdB family protein [Myxococcales bacterium]
MAQFDVHRNPRGGEFPLLLDIQADIVASLATRIVVPLTRRKRTTRPIARINPLAMIEGVEFVLLFQELAAIPTSSLGPRISSLATQRAELVAAIDWLLTGV